MLSIRQSTYRGRAGFLVCGSLPDKAWPVKVFAETREQAELARDNLQAGRPAFSPPGQLSELPEAF